MSKVQFVNPNLIRVTTSLTADQLAIVKELDPRLLSLTDEEGNVLFRVDEGRASSVSRFGVCFTEVAGQFIATAEFDIHKPTSKYIACHIQECVEEIEEAVSVFLDTLPNYEIEML